MLRLAQYELREGLQMHLASPSLLHQVDSPGWVGGTCIREELGHWKGIN